MNDDLISRQAAIDIFDDYNIAVENGEIESYRRYREQLSCLPSIQPKTGHWIEVMIGDMPAQACDRCKTFYPLAYTGGGHHYCPNCGAKMEGGAE